MFLFNDLKSLRVENAVLKVATFSMFMFSRVLCGPWEGSKGTFLGIPLRRLCQRESSSLRRPRGEHSWNLVERRLKGTTLYRATDLYKPHVHSRPLIRPSSSHWSHVYSRPPKALAPLFTPYGKDIIFTLHAFTLTRNSPTLLLLTHT